MSMFSTSRKQLGCAIVSVFHMAAGKFFVAPTEPAFSPPASCAQVDSPLPVRCISRRADRSALRCTPPPTTMAGGKSSRTPKVSIHGGNVSHVGNKMKRQDLAQAYKASKKKEKLQRRKALVKAERLGGEEGKKLREQRLATNIPRTIENTRAYNPTILNAPNTHPGPEQLKRPPVEPSGSDSRSDSDPDAESDSEEEESPQQTARQARVQDEDQDQGADGDQHDSDEEEEEEEEDEDEDEEADPHAPPAILITTAMQSNSLVPHAKSLNNRARPYERTRLFIKDLLNMFPEAEYRARGKAQGVALGTIAGWARKRGYDAMLVVGEDYHTKAPAYLTMIKLPQGPTAFFRLTGLQLGKEVANHGTSTGHTPELILNNFTTGLGHSIGKLFQSLFPAIPQLEGRQVVTAHNQRDYIFIRRHRYIFASADKARLQEIGPRFTLKLRSLKNTLPKGAGVWDGVVDYMGDGQNVVYTKHADQPPPLQAQDGADEEDEESAALAELESGFSAPTSKSAPPAAAEEVSGVEFQWKPKMSVSRRNFYL